MKISALLGNYPGTRFFRDTPNPDLDVDFLPGRPVTHFRKFARDLHIDIAEFPIMTFLMAHEREAPLALLPAVVLGGYQHAHLFCKAGGPIRHPADLAGKRIGVRAYPVTTVTWLRDILEREHGVSRNDITWVTFEEPHLDNFDNPANVSPAPDGLTAEEMLNNGALDAAVLRAAPDGYDFVPVIPNPHSAGKTWCQRESAIQINHVMTVPRTFAARHPLVVTNFIQALETSIKMAGNPTPFGRKAVEPSLSLAIACARRQGIIRKTANVDNLYSCNGLG
ncbi:ABC transporter substrate-binding protein [Puniceibacterium sp. IMCC21224]|uniref:ABC transporter substrate-binding protein n=1 Tax=Puniceibacterium sp. IMCC21224 TaxID=1618204 RepID=UPI00065DACEA|nr:ABC transporter substrate-binding protein [Puniceibacterium sp. IMCC21224]KMK66881.1 NMT1/THI5 like [Puniceibacterium sp. IMCC21224]